jgi:GGDEF domain-containing protein
MLPGSQQAHNCAPENEEARIRTAGFFSTQIACPTPTFLGAMTCGPPGSDENRGLTLSVAVVQVMEGDDSISLLKRAEAALDAADRRGGNRAYYHDGERCAPITAMLEAMDCLA